MASRPPPPVVHCFLAALLAQRIQKDIIHPVAFRAGVPADY